jgi:hypothetical protein
MIGMEIKIETLLYPGSKGFAASATVFRDNDTYTSHEAYDEKTEVGAYKTLTKELVKLLEQCNQTKPSP